MNPNDCPDCGAEDRLHDEIECALADSALEPSCRHELADEARRRAGASPDRVATEDRGRRIAMPKGREKLVVVALAATVLLIVGVSVALMPTDERAEKPGERPDDVGVARGPDEEPLAPDPVPRDSKVGKLPVVAGDAPKQIAPRAGSLAEDPLPERAAAPIGVLAGEVRAPDGRRLEGVKVKLSYDTYRSGEKKLPAGEDRVRNATTDTSGEFRFQDLPPGQWRLEVAHADFAPRVLTGLEVQEDGGLEGIPVVLVGAGAVEGVSDDVGAVEGVVTDRDGNPVVKARIYASGDGSAGQQSTRTDETGKYRIGMLLPGSYRVVYTPNLPKGASAEERSQAGTQTEYVNIAPGKVAKVDFTGSGTLTGIALDSQGNPLADVIVRIAPLDEKGRFRGGNYRPIQVRTDPDGRFEIANAGTGPHSAGIQSVKSGDSFSVRLENIELTGGDQEITLQLKDSGIAGRIMLAETRAMPESRPQISLYRVKPWGSVGMAFMDKEGRYRFKSIPAGKYQLRVYLRGYRTATVEIDLGDGELRTGVDVEMEKLVPGTVVFRVKDAQGKPIDGVSFSWNSSGNLWSTLMTDQSEPGVYVCKQLEGGTRKINIYRPDLATKQLEVKVVAGETVEVEVTMGPRPVKENGEGR